MKDQQIVELINKKVQEGIDKYKNELKSIFQDEVKTYNEKIQEVEKLFDQYTQAKNDNEAREHKEENPERHTGSRNRTVIFAELRQHMMQFQENWEHNTDHADGKYTSQKHEEWDKKRIRLEEELKNSPS